MKPIRYAIFTSLVFLLSIAAPTASQAQSVTLSFTSVVTGLSQPIDIVRAPSDTDRLFIVQKGGTVRIVKSGALQAGNFLNISSIIATTSEQGLLSIAFHPQHATNRMFWVVYNNTAGDIVLARYTTLAGDTNAADPASATIVTTIPHPTNANHNGGRILFGTDGYLYWSVGDGGGGGDIPNNAQTGSNRLGKMLRLNVSTGGTAPYFSTPPTNPFVGIAGFDPLVYQYGLRNPFRWSFDRQNGDMWIGDVGQDNWEEIDYTPASTAAGRDWGWRCREGAHTYNTTGGCATGSYTGYTDPVYEYPQGSPTGGASVTGGYVYRGAAYPALVGRYVCADYVSDNVFVVSPNGAGGFTGEVQTANVPADLTGFGENAAGELFAVSITAGVMYAISATGTPLSIEEPLLLTHRRSDKNCELFSWNGNAAVRRYALEWSADARRFQEVSSNTGTPYETMLCDADRRAGYYLLRSEGLDGSIGYSTIVRLESDVAETAVQLLPNPVASGASLRITTAFPVTSIVIRDMQGRPTFSSTATLKVGTHALNLPSLPSGIYTAQIYGLSGAVHTHRLVIR